MWLVPMKLQERKVNVCNLTNYFKILIHSGHQPLRTLNLTESNYNCSITLPYI